MSSMTPELLDKYIFSYPFHVYFNLIYSQDFSSSVLCVSPSLSGLDYHHQKGHRSLHGVPRWGTPLLPVSQLPGIAQSDGHGQGLLTKLW